MNLNFVIIPTNTIIENEEFMEVLKIISNKQSIKQSEKDQQLQKDSKIHSKIIRLIREKKYPMHISSRSNILFPKIKDKYHKLPQDKTIGLTKKYIEINIDSQRRNSDPRLRTDIQQQMIHRYKLNAQSKESDLLKFQKSLYSKLQNFEKKTKDAANSQIKTQNRYSSCHFSTSKLDIGNIFVRKHQESILETEQDDHKQVMHKIRVQIQRQKSNYIKKINLTDILEPSKDKENVNLQYIVSQLQKKKKNDKQTIGRVKKIAYQDQSPNGLHSYIALMTNKKEKDLNLWETFEKEEAIKEKIMEDQMRSTHLIKTCPDQHTTIVEQQSEIKQENILSAKFRLKSNHRKLIEISKGKNK